MNRILNAVLGVAVLLSVLAAPVIVKAVSTTSSAQELITSLEAQIARLKAQIAEFNVQLEALKKAQTEIKETVKEVTGTLKLIKHLRVGMSGDDVKTLQELLATDRDVYPEGLITGYFGRLTEKAVRVLQKKLCLDQVGQVGPHTLRRINELLEEGAGKSYGGEGGHVPAGLLRAPGIQAKLCGTATTTPDTVAPVISDVETDDITSTTAKIEWETNERADSKVWYGAATPVVTATPTAMVSSPNFVKEHSVALTGLTATTTYYYVAVSADAAGNATSAPQQSFTTLGQ